MTLTFFIVTGLPHLFSFFFFNDTATTEIYTLSLHDALPIFSGRPCRSAIAAATPGSASRIRQRRPQTDRSIPRNGAAEPPNAMPSIRHRHPGTSRGRGPRVGALRPLDSRFRGNDD